MKESFNVIDIDTKQLTDEELEKQFQDALATMGKHNPVEILKMPLIAQRPWRERVNEESPLNKCATEKSLAVHPHTSGT
jgi:hypothetical protein